jgi:hypothetical protein
MEVLSLILLRYRFYNTNGGLREAGNPAKKKQTGIRFAFLIRVCFGSAAIVMP